jgi:uncharacterized protein (DUF697 family)
MPKSSSNFHDSFNFAHHAAFVRRNRAIHGLILDYSLGLAIVGLNPIPNSLWITLLVAVVLLIKMSRDVGKKWGFPRVYNPFAYVGLLFGAMGSLVLSAIAGLVLFLLGQIFPVLAAFLLSAVLFTLTWAWGQTIHHFFANGFPKRTQYHRIKALPSVADSAPDID